MKKYSIVFALCTLLSTPGTEAQVWKSHFAYNNVTQIAMAPECVYALSDGSLFSVDKQTEQIRTYNRQSGLHGTGITCIHYDEKSGQLIIAYKTGQIDLLSNRGVKYLSELYDKDMTQRKTIYNVTIDGRTAYLSTHYGIQTLDLRENKLVDSYWLRPGGQEIEVQDVLIANDSIYAFTEDSMFCAAMSDNLVNYTFWQREARSARIQPDPNKGLYYRDSQSHWYAGYEKGIRRTTATETIYYKPEGPLANTPYRLHCAQGKLFMLQGGRWSAQYEKPGIVMIFDGEHWTNITNDAIQAKTGIPPLDFMNVAVDPQDKHHFFVTSYGTGLYEFQGTELIRHYLPDSDNTLESAVADHPATYTRLDFATYDANGNLWILVGGEVNNAFACIDPSGQWHGIPLLENNEIVPLHTSGGLIFDKLHPTRRWIIEARFNTGLFLLDDGGTPMDKSDDKAIGRNSWVTKDGKTVTVENIYSAIQSTDGRIWIATDHGIVIIEPDTDYFQSDICTRPQLTDNNGENPMIEQEVSALCQDIEGNIWVGTNTLGVYVLNSDATEILFHYTTDNSSMSDNNILSLACNEQGTVFIGTGGGLVEFRPYDTPESLSQTDNSEDLDLGSVQQWKLHYSYANTREIAATPDKIFAIASGSLFSVDRATDRMTYLSKSTGLNSSNIVHIAYDAISEKLVIAYEDGRIDLMDKKGNVQSMPDLHMKASSLAVTVNTIHPGTHFVYLGMPFGILVLSPGKAEITDTYYIGENASEVDVQQVVECGDSLYAFTDGYIYSAALKDNLVDYAYWHKSPLPDGEITHAVAFQNELHILLNATLYKRQNGGWRPVLDKQVNWLHMANGQLLADLTSLGLYRIGEDYQPIGLTGQYWSNDAVYSKGEYWLADRYQGLVRLSTNGDDHFLPNGPNSNFGYFLCAAHNRIYSTVGGRWAGEFGRPARINIYDGTFWTGIDENDIHQRMGIWAPDPVSIAVDPNDAGHFYLATYSAGVLEFSNYQLVKQYTTDTVYHSTTLREAIPGIDARYYTRTDGVVLDDQGNLWVLNATTVGKPVHVLTPSGKWYALSLRSGGQDISLTTPSGIWFDKRNSQRKWMIDQRYTQGLILLDDGGTPTSSYDDRCIRRSDFTDQNGNLLTPSYFYCVAQDNTNRLWVGTESGIILIPAETDFFTSNACQRIIIPRNDGTGLGDYLLGNEQINCMAVDGGNRMWIGTANSGLYLIEDDTITVAHFTEANSSIPSDNIQSICIIPSTGEVFVGTDKGIASYLSDASEPQEDMSKAYAYPNPVRPDYSGTIAITGLMDETVVNIVDAGGNLVCKTRSHGGTAVWDGRLPDGRRATGGVYTALCNAEGGHTAVKILVIQ